ncbi:Quinonprotein alcohol dehydrogenase-like superfamily [Pseudocohnilembus persalinus]|uniref:Quinonprotein alcohol dehydrogenase-like superfamily n=1 Tax=Pseudocohnilembus persalinus TaxID=266149 RepID=A0A0V0QD93_PSEPJ|nr:Quinonprotein alcohol dehydrogenase-like superfamily [Pseudocohnilembus persalinus]|eukprot:KRX00179.1 Quinonprotein alcohol dehydrogenase-like superfamily [Pseudocohnilembus persalinus]
MDKEDMLWGNPIHPLDLNLSDFQEIHKEMLKYQKENEENEEGIRKEISWQEFQQMLDSESNYREQLLNWYMYGIKSKRYVQEAKDLILKPSNRKTERIFNIEQMKEIQLQNRSLFVVLFDEGTISILNQEYKNIDEFKITSIFEHSDIMEKAIQTLPKKFKQSNVIDYSDPNKVEFIQEDKGRKVSIQLNDIFIIEKKVDGKYVKDIEQLTYSYKDGILYDQDSYGENIREQDQERVVLFLKKLCKQVFIKFNEIEDDTFRVLECEICQAQNKKSQLIMTQSPYKRLCKGWYCMHCQQRQNLEAASMHCEEHYYDICLVCFQLGHRKKIFLDPIQSNLDIIQSQMSLIWKTFQNIPPSQLSEFCEIINSMIQNKELDKINIHYLETIKQQFNANRKIDLEIGEIAKQERLKQKYKNQIEQKRRQNLLQQIFSQTHSDQQWLDVNPRNLKFKKPPSLPQRSYSLQQDNSRNGFRNDSQYSINNKNCKSYQNAIYVSKAKVHINEIDFDPSNQLLGIALNSNEVMIYHIYFEKVIDKKNLLLISQTKNQDKTQDIYIVKVYNYSYDIKNHQKFIYDKKELFTHQLMYDVDCSKFYDALGLVCINYKGGLQIIVNKSLENDNNNQNYFDVLLQDVYHNEDKHISWCCMTYHQKQDILVFGTLDSKLVFFNPSISNNKYLFYSAQIIQQIEYYHYFQQKEKLIACKKIGKSIQIIDIHINESQNQAIFFTQDKNIYIYDILRYELLQKFPFYYGNRFNVNVSLTYFSQKQEKIYACFNGMKYWDSYDDKSVSQYSNQMTILHKWRNQTKQQQQLRNEDPFQPKQNFKELKQNNLAQHYTNQETFQDMDVVIYATTDGNLYAQNIYTGLVYDVLEKYDNFPQYINNIHFLPENSEYFIACTTDQGYILWVSFNLNSQSNKNRKKIHKLTPAFNSKSKIISSDIQDQTFSVAGENSFLSIFNLQSCSKKHEINMKKYLNLKSQQQLPSYINKAQFDDSVYIVKIQYQQSENDIDQILNNQNIPTPSKILSMQPNNRNSIKPNQQKTILKKLQTSIMNQNEMHQNIINSNKNPQILPKTTNNNPTKHILQTQTSEQITSNNLNRKFTSKKRFQEKEYIYCLMSSGHLVKINTTDCIILNHFKCQIDPDSSFINNVIDNQIYSINENGKISIYDNKQKQTQNNLGDDEGFWADHRPRAEEIVLQAESIVKGYNVDKEPRLKYETTRLYEKKSPCKTERDNVRERERQRNRQNINFFCKYVLAKKNKTIPYK